MKKALAILLTAAFLLCVTAGCSASGGSGTTAATTAAQAATTAATQAATTAPVASGNFHETGYPIVDDQITFTCMNSVSSTTKEFETLRLMQKYEELTNIHMEWQNIGEADFEQKLSLTLASATMPDWIYSTISYDLLYKYGTVGGMFYDITDLVDQYMPNLVSWFDDCWFIKPTMVMEDGTIYGVPYFYKDPVDANGTMFLRTDMLDKVGKEIPTTVDEFYDLLVTFKESDLFGKDFYPIEIRGDGSDFLSGHFCNWLFPAFGDATTVGFADDGNGNVVYNYISDQFKNYIEFTAKCFKEELVDPETFTQDFATAVSKIRANNCAFTTGATSLSTDNFDSGEIDVVIVAPLTSQYSSDQKVKNQGWGARISAVINKKCENVPALLRWMDIGYTKEENIQGTGIGYGSYQYGLNGFNFEWSNAERTGLNTWTPEEYAAEAANMSDQEFRYTFITPYFRIASGVDNIVEYSDPAQKMKATQTMENIFPYMEDTAFPDSMLRLTPDEQEEYVQIFTDIDTYVKNEVAKFITGMRSMDEWNNYVSDIEKMGIKDALAIKQTAYNRYRELFK